MASEREAFLRAIEKDPFDMSVRKVFADWLDEFGTDADAELATEQREWTREKTEALQFMESFGLEVDLSAEDLLALAGRYLETGETGYLGFDTPDRVYDDNEEFWRHYQYLTKTVVPEHKQHNFFRCSC